MEWKLFSFFGAEITTKVSLSAGSRQQGSDEWRGDKEKLINWRRKRDAQNMTPRNTAANLTAAYFQWGWVRWVRWVRWVSRVIGCYFFPPSHLHPPLLEKENNRHKKPEALRFRPRPTGRPASLLIKYSASGSAQTTQTSS